MDSPDPADPVTPPPGTADELEPDAGPETEDDLAARRWSTGVWPVLAGVLVVGAAAVALVPAVRAQAELSFTRESPEFVELSAVTLDGDSNVGTTCLPSRDRPGTTDVTFAVTSHRSERTELDVRVRVDTARGRVGRVQGDLVRLDPGETKSRTAEVAVPRSGAWTIQVKLPETDQYLLLHCGGPR